MTVAPTPHRFTHADGTVVPPGRPELTWTHPSRAGVLSRTAGPEGPRCDLVLAAHLESLAVAADAEGCVDRSWRLRQAARILRASVAPAPAATEAVDATADDPAAVLTTRQLQVADRVARGLTNRQIAGELGISERTAESHIKNILIKMGYAARTQIAALVGRHDLTRLPGTAYVPARSMQPARLSAAAGGLS